MRGMGLEKISGRDRGKKLIYVIYLFVAVTSIYLLINSLRTPEVRYVCPDGEIVKRSGDCILPEPEVVVIERNAPNVSCNTSITYLTNCTQIIYVCEDGRVTGNISECLPAANISETSTTTSSTTTSTIKSNRECVKLGCPYGTNYVGSKKRGEYYSCRCYIARYLIGKEDLLCFDSIQAARTHIYGENRTLIPCKLCPDIN